MLDKGFLLAMKFIPQRSCLRRERREKIRNRGIVAQSIHRYPHPFCLAKGRAEAFSTSRSYKFQEDRGEDLKKVIEECVQHFLAGTLGLDRDC